MQSKGFSAHPGHLHSERQFGAADVTPLTAQQGYRDNGALNAPRFAEPCIKAQASPTLRSLLGRVLRRPKSKKRSTAVSSTITTSEKPPSNLTPKAVGSVARTNPLPSISKQTSNLTPPVSLPKTALVRSDLSGAQSSVLPSTQATPNPTTASHEEAMHQEVPTPAKASLKRQPSLRDRLRFWPATPAPAPEADTKPRQPYVPTHAASDFSRVVVAPRPLTSLYYDQRQSLPPPRRDREAPEGPDGTEKNRWPDGRLKRHSHTLRPVPEAELNSKVERQAQHGLASQKTDSSQNRKDPRHHRHLSNPFDDAHEALYPSGGRLSEPIHSLPEDDMKQLSPEDTESPSLDSQNPDKELTDYQQFIARAAAEERTAQRAEIRRSLTRHRAYPPPDERSKFDPDGYYVYPSFPNPPDMNSAAAVSTKRRSQLFGTGGGGSKSSGSKSKRDSGYHTHARQGSGGAAMDQSNRTSWTPSLVRQAADDAEERDRVAELADDGVLGGGSQRAFGAGEEKPLRRQPSLRKRVSEYIKPPREGGGLRKGADD